MIATRGQLELDIDRLSARLERILSQDDFASTLLIGVAEAASDIEARAMPTDLGHVSTRLQWMFRQHGLPENPGDVLDSARGGIVDPLVERPAQG